MNPSSISPDRPDLPDGDIPSLSEVGLNNGADLIKSHDGLGGSDDGKAILPWPKLSSNSDADAPVGGMTLYQGYLKGVGKSSLARMLHIVKDAELQKESHGLGVVGDEGGLGGVESAHPPTAAENTSDEKPAGGKAL